MNTLSTAVKEFNNNNVEDLMEFKLKKSDAELYVPKKDELYEHTEIYPKIEKIVDSGKFFPALITGPTGIAKTLTVEQVFANKNKELMRVNITIESDEDSLMGGFRLKDGNTYFDKGPVIIAMERGCTLLLDEIDLGNPSRLLCLQSVLEGRGYLIKKTGEWVPAKKGFNIILTANTKGGGDENGMYVGTQILNEAMMDRIPITMEATYPSEETEIRIINRLFDSLGVTNVDKTVKLMIKFARDVRDTVEKSADIIHNISTRRLCQIATAYSVYGDLRESVEMCLSRFDNHHKDAYMKLFDLLSDDSPKKPDTKDDDDEDFMKQLKALKAF